MLNVISVDVESIKVVVDGSFLELHFHEQIVSVVMVRNSRFLGKRPGQLVSLKPIPSQLKLYGVDPGVGHRQPSVRDVLVAHVKTKGTFLVHKEMRAESGMSQKVYPRGVQRPLGVANQYASAQPKIRPMPRPTLEVQFHIQ